MCGIAGAIDVAAGRAAAQVSMVNEAQRHRGPDHSVVARVGGFTLGNTRLAVQDPGPAGNQPFVSADGRYHCVFNGEIYNHRLLIERYRLPVRTACDGEIIPELWARLGAASLAELRGMFAIALVDSWQERLYLARDPFGMKPLHWRATPEGLLFASEVRPLARMAGGARIDPAAVARYLHLGAMAADQAPFLEIMALPPNSVAAFGLDCRATLRPILPDGPLAGTGAPASLESALAGSIELHLGADVPTALLLSAGIDSAAIAAVSRGLGRDLDCLTVATEGAADEGTGAAETARQYGHRVKRIPAVLEEGDVTRFFAAMQRPSIDGLNTYLVCKAVHEAGFKVALSGLGGDEAVGGYSHFRLLRFLPALRALDTMPGPVNGAAAELLARMGVAGKAKLRRLLGSGGPRDGWGLSLLQREVLPRSLVADLTGFRCRRPVDAEPSRSVRYAGSFATMVAAEVAIYLQAMLLPDADAFSMASSVELRLPFVDTHVFPASLGCAAGTGTRPGKKAIGAALDDPYLTGLAAHPKRGFSLPMRRWMTGPLAPALRAAGEPDAAVWSVVDREVAERDGLIPLLARGRWAETWALAALNTWLETIKSEARGTLMRGDPRLGARGA
jgi:asparagine synthase (glutamine-hydrolysing)